MTVIAMTREIGSHGSEVAAGVAATLGLEIINSEIVVPDVAGSLGVEQSAVQRYLEGKASLFDRWQIDARNLSRYTLDQILNLALKDNVLIRGWGAAALFQGIRGVICVRVCAPMNFRVQVIMERLSIKDAEAVREQIQRYDVAHARAMRTSFGIEQEDALLYHIILNTERLSVGACVRAVCTLAEDPRFQDQARTRSVLSDKLLEAKINAALADHVNMAMAPAGVIVSAANGRVTLAGVTSSGGLRAKAEHVTQSIAGVCDIDNRIVSVPNRGRPQHNAIPNV